MNPLGQSQNIAARMGRWSARHWKTATLGWLALIALVFVLGSRVGTKELSDARGMNGDSARAQHIIDSAGFPDNPAEVVLVQSTTLTVRDAAFRRAVEDVVRALSQVKGVEHVRSPYTRGNEDQLSKSGRSATGGPSIDRALDDTVEKDFRRAEFSSIPLTLGILLVAVGALLAAFLPVLLALTAFAGATGVLAFASQLLPVDDAAGSVMLLIGLAVGVDYSLFYLKREREERALGKGREAALEAAAATSGRSVLISGLTVIVAMAGISWPGTRRSSASGSARSSSSRLPFSAR
jgi:uncharacterized membrane protein YdfJ with MMPL/SSD domain